MRGLLCALCTYLSASSFALAYGILKSEPYPAIATLHGILAAVAVPVFALFMIYAPERRETALFAFVFILAVSAAIPLWQYGKRLQSPSPQPPAAGEVALIQSVTTTPIPTQPVGATNVPDQPRVQTPRTEQTSYFPRELENKYFDIQYVGRGGIAWVYAAKRKSDGKKVAVKIPISFDEMTGKSFLTRSRRGRCYGTLTLSRYRQ